MLIGLLVSCSGKKETENAEKVQINPEFSRYVAAFTGGVIPSNGSIKVQFNEEVSDENRKKDLSSAFVLTPAAAGAVQWIDNRTLEFVPDEPLLGGTLYKVSVDMTELMDVDDGLETFEFNFQTERKTFAVNFDRFATYDSDNFIRQKLIGTVTFSEAVDSSKVKETMTAKQGDESLKIKFIKESSNTYSFVIHDIIRKETRSTLNVKWDGAPVGIERSGNKMIKIPNKTEFVIMDVEVNHAPEQYVRIHFSDPLNPDQFMEGLVYLQDHDVTVTVDEQLVVLYPTERIVGSETVKIAFGIENSKGKQLSSSKDYSIYFDDIAPGLELVGEGNIVPLAGDAHFPFSAVNLIAVDVTITQIFEDNVLQFLQVNDYDGTYQLRRVGQEVFQERVELDPGGGMNLSEWNNFSIDLSKYVKTEPGAIYRVSISARKEYSLYDCKDKGIEEELTTFAFASNDEPWSESDWDSYGYYYDYDYEDYYYDDYYYSDNNSASDPCNEYYFTKEEISRNILISDIGMIAKAGEDKRMHIILSDLSTTAPIESATVKFYDFQQQFLGEAKSDDQGMLDMYLEKKPFVAVAEKDGQKGYLRLMDGESLSLSKFDVSGESVQRGVKGFIYSERGVWRPGDSIYLSFMLEDKDDLLPESHPVKFQLTDPHGTIVDEQTRTTSVNGLYDFRTATSSEAPTGGYGARVMVGNRTYYEWLKVETVKPNRLKIEMEFGGGDMLSSETERNVNLDVKWLHGAVANALNTKVDVHLTSSYTTFKGLNMFTFDDPLKEFQTEDKTIFEGRLGEDGKISFDHGINLTTAAPGMLRAYFTTKVFEEGGEFSIDRQNVAYSPYSRYAGIRIPDGDMYGGTLETEKDHLIDIVTVTEKGKPIASDVKVTVYKLEWRWWWDNYDSDLSSYIARTSTVPYDVKEINTIEGRGRYKLNVDKQDWGRFLILAEDQTSGHTTGQIVYVDWPYYARADRSTGENATMLAFTTDKEKYNKGETVTLTIPTPEEGKALVSLESGTKIIDKFWVDTKKGETTCTFETTDEMDPNVFVHVSLIQPYQTKSNDMPIRMYGVVPITVEDPSSHLHPVISMPEILRPETTASIKVSEKNGKPMSYTLAIVDEGLLDLTNFNTPDPWSHFNAREALGVKTWDMYDFVLGAFGEDMDKLLAIGGDGDGEGDKGAKANRFKPMVKFLGPFEISGETKTHKIEIPNYVGSVRVMVVAGQDNAYGNAEKTVPVRNPLMVLATLPRVVGPGENVTLPVNVFAMEKHVTNVSLSVTVNDFFTINGSAKQAITFSKIGDKVINFDLTVAKRIGLGKVTVNAVSGNEKASYSFEIDVRTPNTEQTTIAEKVLSGGESFESAVEYFGVRGTNKAYLEVSNFPAIDLGRRLDYLIQYPHGCIEQTTSSVFPQLFLADLMELDATRKTTIQANINAAIEQIKLFQVSGGGFSYWPGMSEANEWGSNYAGHFLLESEKKGFKVPTGMKNSWISFQKKAAKNWSKSGTGIDRATYDDLTQSYRLYTLALAGKPEIGLMNRLRERADLSLPARWRLAAAYQLAGQPEAASNLIKGRANYIPEYAELSYTYGSNYRDEAMILEALVLMGKMTDAAVVAKRLAENLNSNLWMSTQTTAYGLMAVSKFVGKNTMENKLKFSYAIDDKTGTRDSEMTMVSFDLKGKTKSVKVNNTGKGILYVRLITKGVPLGGEEVSVENNIELTVKYFDMNSRPLDVATMRQGTDFMAEITVFNPGIRGPLKELALSHIVPSGWEIHNSRMDQYDSDNSSYYTYQDIRDDRVYTYFDLGPGKQKTFRVQLNSSYLGKFYLPGIAVEAMYDNSIYARVKGQWISVVREISI